MEVYSIVLLVTTILLGLERLTKHIKKSKCLGGEIEFRNNSTPNLQELPIEIQNPLFKNRERII